MPNGWHRANKHSPASRARAREYNSPAYREAKAAAQRAVASGTAHCWRCGQWIPPHSAWHTGHDDHDRSIIRGPEHASCNLHAAARRGAQIANARRSQRGTAPAQPIRRRLLG